MVNIPLIIIIFTTYTKQNYYKYNSFLNKYKIYSKIEQWIIKKMSRKLLLLYIVLITATLGTFAPPIIVWAINFTGKNSPPLTILGSTEWVTIVTLLVTTYFGANHMEKRLALQNNIVPEQLDTTITQIQQSQGMSQQVDVQVKNQQDVNIDVDREQAINDLKHGK